MEDSEKARVKKRKEGEKLHGSLYQAFYPSRGGCYLLDGSPVGLRRGRRIFIFGRKGVVYRDAIRGEAYRPQGPYSARSRGYGAVIPISVPRGAYGRLLAFLGGTLGGIMVLTILLRCAKMYFAVIVIMMAGEFYMEKARLGSLERLLTPPNRTEGCRKELA